MSHPDVPGDEMKIPITQLLLLLLLLAFQMPIDKVHLTDSFLHSFIRKQFPENVNFLRCFR